MNQIGGKPAKRKKYLKHNSPKGQKYGIGVRKCKRCGRFGAHIRKYGLNLCRQCFKDLAPKIGFKKYGHEV